MRLRESLDAILHARADWDNFETSWDFRDLPLLRPGLKGATLEASWRNWETQSTAAICRMQELETENNRLLIAAYGLDEELQPHVLEEQITLARADSRRDMAAFLSYAVGCIVGCYSLDRPGLFLANAGGTLPDFLEKGGRPLEALTFVPNDDGIVPVLDGDWFEDESWDAPARSCASHSASRRWSRTWSSSKTRSAKIYENTSSPTSTRTTFRPIKSAPSTGSFRARKNNSVPSSTSTVTRGTQ